MKKFILALALVILAAPCFAAQTATVWAVYDVPGFGIEVHATYTCDDTDGTFATEVFKDSSGNTLHLAGYYLYQVVHDVGATGVTANSDLYIPQHINTGYDLMNGAGVDFLDNSDATPLANIK